MFHNIFIAYYYLSQFFRAYLVLFGMNMQPKHVQYKIYIGLQIRFYLFSSFCLAFLLYSSRESISSILLCRTMCVYFVSSHENL